MNLSFYTAAVGAGGQRAKMDVIANNLANVNTNGYKSKNAEFADLIYTDMATGGEPQALKGHSIRLEKTDINFKEPGALAQTGRTLDFAIQGNGFFAVQDPNTGDIFYTRDGRFQITNMDGSFFLTDSMGRQVLDSEEDTIEMRVPSMEDAEDMADELNLSGIIGIFKVPIQDGIEAAGYNGFTVSEKNGELYSQADADEEEPRSTLLQGMIELSNVDLAKELTQIMEAQRNFQYALKMVQTSDEIDQLQNELRR